MKQDSHPAGLVAVLVASALLLSLSSHRSTTRDLPPGGLRIADNCPTQGFTREKASAPDILKGTYQAFVDDRTLAVSAGATFYGLLALFPAIASFVAVYGFFADSTGITKQLDALGDVLPGGALDIIREQTARISSKGSTALTWAFAIGLVTSIWSANAGIKAMFDALNVAYGLKERRSFIALNSVALAFTVGFIAVTALAAFLLVAIVPLLTRLGGSEAASSIATIGRWPLLFIFLSLAIALMYRFGPSPQDRHWRWLTPGSILAALSWCIVSTAFSFYAAHFGSYNATYGSLGAAIGMMTWMWLSITVILLGAELNAQIDKATDAKRENPI